jgi:hypothetical protein
MKESASTVNPSSEDLVVNPVKVRKAYVAPAVEALGCLAGLTSGEGAGSKDGYHLGS